MRRARRALSVVGFVAVLMGLPLAAPSPALAGPVNDLRSHANSQVAPGDGDPSTAEHTYYIWVNNTGDQATPDADEDGLADQPRTLQVTLPPGITLVDVPRAFNWDCTGLVPGSSTLTCSSDVVSDPHSQQTRLAWLFLAASVDSSASGILSASLSVTGGGAPAVDTVDPTLVTDAAPQFGIDAFDAQVTDPGGGPFTEAAGHPYAATASVFFNTFTYDPGSEVRGDTWPVEPAKDAFVDLPPGFLGNPTATAGISCTSEQLANSEASVPKSLCPSASQVGVATVYGPRGAVLETPIPVFNLLPPPTSPARFGMNVLGTQVVFDGLLRSDGDFGVTVAARSIPEGLALAGSTVTFWGAPADPSHLTERSCPGEISAGKGGPSCPSGLPSSEAFLRNPTSCGPAGAGLQTGLRVDSWFHPGLFETAGFASHEAPGFPYPREDWGPEVGIEECDAVPFTPSFSARPTTDQADSPSGLTVDLAVPQDALSDPGAVSQSDLRDALITLPEGISVNPASADGLGACSPAQIGLIGTGFPAPNPIHFDQAAPTCPSSSRLGTVAIATPLLEEELQGSVYLAAQGDNPFGSLLALYIVVKGPGVILKLAGRVEAKPDGRLITHFDNQPQLPFEALHLELFGGSRAALRTPPACGSYTTQAALAPWSGNAPAELKSSFQITAGPAGSPCPSGAFVPALRAGSLDPLPGAFSPFHLRLSRADGTREITSLSATLPPGLIGRLAGIPACPELALAAVSEAEGTAAAQIAAPSCPAASQLGTVTVGAGAGPNPIYVSTGRAYLAGPYKGAPLSIAVITPAKAGPFDLGSVLIRNALRIDPQTTRITAVSDPIPTLLHGIGLDLRDIRVEVDRPDFTLNPTSCDPSAVEASLSGTGGTSASRSERFQVAGCSSLPFKPRLSLRLKGKTHRRAHPALIANLTARPGDANIARAQVRLPKAAFLDNAHIKEVCTRVQFAAHACPAGSIYGRASATTPLLDYPLTGNVYLRSSAHQLPDLVVSLRGPDTQPIEIELAGRTDSVKGALRNTFEAVPDAPVTAFHLELFGGKRGLVELSSGLCAHPRASIKLDGQNGKIHDTTPVVGTKCPRPGTAKHPSKR